MSQRISRRRILQTLGGLTTGTAGCTGGNQSTDTPNESSPSTPRETKATTTTTGQQTLAVPNAASRSYLAFSPWPSRANLSPNYLFKARRPAQANAHGLSDDWFQPNIAGVDREQIKLAVWVELVFGAITDVDQSAMVAAYRHRNFEPVTTYRGFQILGEPGERYPGNPVAVGDGVLLRTESTEDETYRTRLQHLIDIQTGVTPPYFSHSDTTAPLVEYLPQGLWMVLDRQTHFWGLKKRGIEAAGQTILPHSSSNSQEYIGRTVLQYDGSLPDVRNAVETLYEDRKGLLRFPQRDPTIVTVDGDTAVIEDRVVPEDVF